MKERKADGDIASATRLNPRVVCQAQRALLVWVSVILMPLFAPAATLKVGDRAPAFTLPDQNGKLVKLEDFRGKKSVVLAFYIRASTPG